MSSLKFITVRRRSAGARRRPRAAGRAGCAFSAAQLPVALNTASGMLRLSLFRRHSRTPPSRATVPAPRLTASISRRPSFLPRSSKSSTTMSSAGSLSGCSSSRVSTSLAAAAAIDRRASRACSRPAPAPGGWRYSTIAVELVGVDVGAPDQAVARAADHHVVQGAAFHRQFPGPHRHHRGQVARRGALPDAARGDGGAARAGAGGAAQHRLPRHRR